MLARHRLPIISEERTLEGGVTHWVHVDWMIAMTSRAACHRLLKVILDSVTILIPDTVNLLTCCFKAVKMVADGDMDCF